MQFNVFYYYYWNLHVITTLYFFHVYSYPVLSPHVSFPYRMK